MGDPDAQERAGGDGAAAGDQARSDADQGAADADQHAAERDQSASARDQATADHDQARAGADPASERAYDTSRAQRAQGAAERAVSASVRDRSAAGRTRDAAARDETARRADIDAAARDRAGAERDRAAEHLEQTAPSYPAGGADTADTAAVLRATAATDRIRSAQDRARAAADRARAAADRRDADSERASARRADLRSDRRADHAESLIARLRAEADVRDEDLAALRVRLDSAEDELQDLRAIRDALTPPELPTRPGLQLAAAFLPAAERVSGDFYLVAPGPGDTTVLVVGDVVGHGLTAARRAAFVRTAFLATAPFTDDPAQLLSWVNTALIERAGTTSEFVTAACLTYHPGRRRLRWAYAGHPPALWLDDAHELDPAEQGIPLGIDTDLHCVEGSARPDPGAGVLLYTDGLTEARRHGDLLGLAAVAGTLAALHHPTPAQAIAALSILAAEYTSGAPTDDLCLLAARIN